ncbi:hypothetical protein HPB48_001119 [Haemaphysalis longicornis]|uniref:Uncharacterized protein n=1 Tax=Haemaphysalis longicornis TaxID=44386 RepID=A0A9J6GGF4_HAELO|nr:hypothetical protein HPB48_001119 [Haemaphysalis longicornis]
MEEKRRNKKCIHARTTENGSKSETDADPCSLRGVPALAAGRWNYGGCRRKKSGAFLYTSPSLRRIRELASEAAKLEAYTRACAARKRRKLFTEQHREGKRKEGSGKKSDSQRRTEKKIPESARRSHPGGSRVPRTLDQLYSGGGRKTPGTTLGRSSMRWPRIADDVCWPSPPLSWEDFQFSPSSAENEA